MGDRPFCGDSSSSWITPLPTDFVVFLFVFFSFLRVLRPLLFFRAIGAAAAVASAVADLMCLLGLSGSFCKSFLIAALEDSLAAASVVVNGEPGDPSMVDERGLCSY